jgi:hypothetical protein
VAMPGTGCSSGALLQGRIRMDEYCLYQLCVPSWLLL